MLAQLCGQGGPAMAQLFRLTIWSSWSTRAPERAKTYSIFGALSGIYVPLFFTSSLLEIYKQSCQNCLYILFFYIDRDCNPYLSGVCSYKIISAFYMASSVLQRYSTDLTQNQHFVPNRCCVFFLAKKIFCKTI